METFILNIRNKAIAKDLENYLSKFNNSIKLIKLHISYKNSKAEKTEKGSFFDIAGIWEDSDITVKKIREKAWRQKNKQKMIYFGFLLK